MPNYGYDESGGYSYNTPAYPSFDQVNSAYQQYLGRPASQDEYNLYWSSRPDYIAGISSSDEAKQYAANQTFQPGGSPTIPPTAVPTPASVISPNTFNSPGQPVATQPSTPSPAQPAPAAATTYPDYAWGGQATNGYVLAGMPLGNAADSAKRAATAYLASGVVNPSDPNWTAKAVQYLNATYPQYGGAFHAIDGETLGIGNDEYIHSAPVGYGIAPGSYDPNARGEFFWGSTGTPATTSSSGTGAVTNSKSNVTGTTLGGSLGGLSTQIQQLISGLMSGGGPSGSYVSGGYAPTGGPIAPDLNQIGQDPLSQLLTGGLAGLINAGGSTPYSDSIKAQLASIINGGGASPNTNTTGSLIAARDAEAQAYQGMMSDLRANLASRGLVSEPGVPQGSESLGMQRISEQLAPVFANAVAAIQQHGLDLQNSNVQQALSLATGMSNNDAQNLLQALSLGTNRQYALSTIALQTLDQNRQWQQFLAQYGLNRDQIAAQIQQGNMQLVVSLISQFLQAAQISAGGYI